jgi:hypothetical protein
MHRLAIVPILAACSGAPGKPSAPAAPPAGSDVTTRSPSPPVDAPTGLGLPPFGKTATSDRAKANELAGNALRALDGLGDPDHAIDDAKAAVMADPGSSLARYAVACTAPDRALATAQLHVLLDAKGCAECADDLNNVASDTECRWDPAQTALAATLRPSPQRAALDVILAALAAADPTGAKPYFTGAHVTAAFACSLCTDASQDRHLGGAGPTVLADIMKAIGEMGPLLPGTRFWHHDDCFGVDWPRLAHNTVYFDSLCFAHGTTSVASMQFTAG